MFDDFFCPTTENGEELSMGNWNPIVDIYDNEDIIVVNAELPGVDKKDILIDIKGKVITLKGERLSENETKDETYYRRERSFGKFERVFVLPVEVNSDKVKADFKDGVLKIFIPKPEEQKTKKITIH
jgi:HSP20 family protein